MPLRYSCLDKYLVHEISLLLEKRALRVAVSFKKLYVGFEPSSKYGCKVTEVDCLSNGFLTAREQALNGVGESVL